MKVLNVLESLGCGGGQIMMYELSNALNKYFGDKCQSLVAGVKSDKNKVVVDGEILNSYGVSPALLSHEDLNVFCKTNNIDIVVHHRVSISRPVKKFLPNHIPYIVVSHTAADLGGIKDFYAYANAVVSVCQNLSAKMPPCNSKKCRTLTILNGIENDFISSIPSMKLRGKFNSGRCHRLVPGKFDLSTLRFFEQNSDKLPGHVHYLMGSGNKSIIPNSRECIEYLGEVKNRDTKYSYIKSLDVYFYEIFTDEGASIAVLEALASGVPPILKNKGGAKELVTHKMNGFIENDRNSMLNRMIRLYSDKDALQQMKNKIKKDFNERLHVKHCAKKYYELFCDILKK